MKNFVVDLGFRVGPRGMASDLRGPPSLGQQGLRIMDTRTPEGIASILPLQFFPQPADFTGPFVEPGAPQRQENSRPESRWHQAVLSYARVWCPHVRSHVQLNGKQAARQRVTPVLSPQR